MRCPNRQCKSNLTRTVWFLQPFNYTASDGGPVEYKHGAKLHSRTCFRCGHISMTIQRELSGGSYSDETDVKSEDIQRYRGFIATYGQSIEQVTGVDAIHTSVTASIESKGNHVGLVEVW